MHTLEEIKAKIGEFVFARQTGPGAEFGPGQAEEFDLIVAVAGGGIIPAALLNQRLGLPFELIKVSLRGPDQVPMYAAPRLVEPLRFDPAGRRVLLVEDRVKTGASLKLARKLLEEAGAEVKTFAVNGPADYSLYDEACFKFPWVL